MYSGKSLGVVALLVFLLALPAYTQSYVYESSFLYLGDYPGNADPFYTVELQGITHDDDYWYITNQWNIFKFHISDDLDSSSPRDSKQLTTIAALNGYNHFGDLSHYKHNGQSYLVIAVEDNVGSLTHVIAVFKSSTLEFMGKAPLTGHISAACCGVDTAGNIYVPYSSGTISAVKKYSLSWDTVPAKTVTLQYLNDFHLKDATGTLSRELRSMQGLVISDSGQLMYTVCGDADNSDSRYGINVFDVQTGQTVGSSSRSLMPFLYKWEPGSFNWQEPEGITIWDLDDDSRVPPNTVSGQLHVLLYENNGDEYWLKHYTHTIHVDSEYGNDANWGGPLYPKKTIGAANNMAWDGARIKIKAGSYRESLTFSKQVQILAEGETVIIGTASRVSLRPTGAINIHSGGNLKIY